MPDQDHEGDVRPTPDPTVLTTAAITRAMTAERDYVNAQLEVLHERLRGIDRATALLDTQVNRFPTVMDREIGHVREAMDVRFAAVGEQFRDRDLRASTETRSARTAVDAALAAQKEAVAAQEISNSRAITKAEATTTDSIAKLSEVLGARTDALAAAIADNKDRVARIESVKAGGREQLTAIYALVAFLVTVLILGTMLAANGVFTD